MARCVYARTSYDNNAIRLSTVGREKRELFTNDDVIRFATDEFCRYELIGGEIIVSTAPRYIYQLYQ
jgi:hypothetical protein